MIVFEHSKNIVDIQLPKIVTYILTKNGMNMLFKFNQFSITKEKEIIFFIDGIRCSPIDKRKATENTVSNNFNFYCAVKYYLSEHQKKTIAEIFDLDRDYYLD